MRAKLGHRIFDHNGQVVGHFWAAVAVVVRVQ
jgi:hypothetical protein